MYLYSPSLRGFFLRSLHGDAVPADAVEVSQQEHAALLQAQEAGQVIEPGSNGLPIAVEPPPSPPPAPIRTIRSLAFRERLPAVKRNAVTVAAMQAAALGDGELLTWLMDQAASTSTSLDDARVIAGVAALSQAGLITAAERDALLADGAHAER